VRGTIWTTTDRCDGTLTVVKRGRTRLAIGLSSKPITDTSSGMRLPRAWSS
jgi:hypothetical protein